MGALEPACDMPQPPSIELAATLDFVTYNMTMAEALVFLIIWFGVGAFVAVIVAHWLRRRG